MSDIDKNGLELYAIKIFREEYTDMNVFAVIIDTKDDEKYYIQEIFWNDTYIIQIEEFKKRNNWTYDYYYS